MRDELLHGTTDVHLDATALGQRAECAYTRPFGWRSNMMRAISFGICLSSIVVQYAARTGYLSCHPGRTLAKPTWPTAQRTAISTRVKSRPNRKAAPGPLATAKPWLAPLLFVGIGFSKHEEKGIQEAFTEDELRSPVRRVGDLWTIFYDVVHPCERGGSCRNEGQHWHTGYEC